jgi:hypothetical protein
MLDESSTERMYIMESQTMFSVVLQLAISAVCAGMAYGLKRWLSEPLRGDDQAQAALDEISRLHQYARERSRRVIYRD